MITRESQRRAGPTLRAAMLGGLIGAASCLGALALVKVSGPTEAFATQGLADERPRGLISAADQRIEIIQRLDRMNATLDAMRRLMEQQAQQPHSAPAPRP